MTAIGGADPSRPFKHYLTVVEGVAVVGLVTGLAWIPVLVLLAAVGLGAFFAIAVAVHVRTRVLHNTAFPVGFLCLAVASVAHFAVQTR